jgi:hypothetical protein
VLTVAGRWCRGPRRFDRGPRLGRGLRFGWGLVFGWGLRCRWRRRRNWLVLRRRHAPRPVWLVRFGHELSMVCDAVRSLRGC